MSTAHVPTLRIGIVCAVAFLGLNVVFFILSSSYFESHRTLVAGISQPSYSPDQMMHVRVTFAVFSGVICALGFLAWIGPRVTGHLIPLVLAAVHLVAGVAAFANQVVSVVGVTLLVSGVLMPILAWHSYRGSRSAWAFLVAICGVFAVADFFGAPKIRAALDIGLWTAMILPGVYAAGAVALILVRRNYVERGLVTA